MTIRALIEAVERGEFITGVLQSHETVAYSAFSGSLDAALALHEALLPGWNVDLRIIDGFGYAMLFAQCPAKSTDTVENANPARAWLLTILRAVEAEGQP